MFVGFVDSNEVLFLKVNYGGSLDQPLTFSYLPGYFQDYPTLDKLYNIS